MHPDPESNNSLFHARKSWAIASLTAVLLAGFEIFLACTNLGHYDDLYDAGNYLESARMMIRGGHLYSTIFDSQPPLWLPLVYGSLRLFGMNFLGGQMLIVATGVLVVLMVGLVTRELSDWPGAWIAAAIVILSPLELQWSRTVSPEVPASAFAVAGMAFAMRYARSGARGPLLMASGLVACSVLVKLLGLFTLPALVLAIAVRHWRVSRAAPPIKLRPLTEDTLIVLGTFAAVIIIALAPFGPALVWKQAV